MATGVLPPAKRSDWSAEQTPAPWNPSSSTACAAAGKLCRGLYEVAIEPQPCDARAHVSDTWIFKVNTIFLFSFPSSLALGELGYFLSMVASG